ncbi:hypothetical protein [uncultured Pseudacidovorax sp.]|uniref:hypothetical protein n=1 Tax=uncultured Pseudacidovorax sp. TaxID=679313 RepID=UPI0025E7C629|nr:hypothetical protein [uncultured Pseudacidovorax sp.]
MDDSKSVYSGTKKILKRYWRAYGGRRALLRSPYLHFACVLLLLTTPTWVRAGWWELPLSVIPNLLGFTLGGFAMFLGFGDEKFRALLADPDEDDPKGPALYQTVTSTFVHFIMVQTIALMIAIVARSWNFYVDWPDPIRGLITAASWVGGAAGYLFFLYAICSVVAATMQLFRVASWYEQHRKMLAEAARNRSIH